MRATRLRQWLLTVLYLLVAIWLASSIWSLIGKARVAVREARDAEREYQALEERRARLEARIAVLETPLGQDAAIRTAFGVARDGEEVIVVVPPQQATTTPEPTLWERVKGWF